MKNKIFTLHKQSGLWVSMDGEVFVPKTKGHTEHFTFGSPNSDGYLMVGWNRKVYKVHRLVAETYLPNPDNLPFVNHRDEDKTNNVVLDGNCNLEWCTASYNNTYGTRNERIAKAMTNGKRSKPVAQFDLQGNLIRTWPSINEIERALGFNCGYICNCCKGKYKTAYGFLWRYVA